MVFRDSSFSSPSCWHVLKFSSSLSLPWGWRACFSWLSLLTMAYVSWFYVEAKAFELWWLKGVYFSVG
jgi:hypothetical protein